VQLTGRDFRSGFKFNTVGGEWADLLAIQVSENPAWSQQRPPYLFGLQADNVASVLYGLENAALVESLVEGTSADKLQSLVEMLRIINVAWRVNNPWGGVNSPLIGRPFALADDGGIGIDDIMRDAVTLKATLDLLVQAWRQGEFPHPNPMLAALCHAYENGLAEVLEMMLDKETLTEAVRWNTQIYRDPLSALHPLSPIIKSILKHLKSLSPEQQAEGLNHLMTAIAHLKIPPWSYDEVKNLRGFSRTLADIRSAKKDLNDGVTLTDLEVFFNELTYDIDCNQIPDIMDTLDASSAGIVG